MPGRGLARPHATLLIGLSLVASAGVARAGGDATPRVPVAFPRALTFRAAIEVSGQIAAVQSATIAAQQPGVAKAVAFRSGQVVQKHQIIVTMDDAVERAQVSLDRAKYDDADRTVARDRRLRAISGISEAQLETDQATRAEMAAQLALDTARRDRRTIRAPFAGVLGIRRVSTGDYIAAGKTITTITQTSPLRVLFAVPETELRDIGAGDAFGFTLPQAGEVAHQGRILALSPTLNAKTRARMIEGRVANASGALLPGAFGMVDIATGTPVAALAVPATAIDYGPLGSYIYAVDRKGKTSVVRAVYVRVLATQGAVATIAAGGVGAIGPIVTLGGFKLQNGQTIIPERSHTQFQAKNTPPPATGS